MQVPQLLTKEDLTVWSWLVSKGISKSMQGLSQMMEKELVVTAFRIEQCPAKDAAELLGGPEKIVVGIYLSISGDAPGHIMLVHDPKMAYELIDMQMGLSPGSTTRMDEMEMSVMGEMGNITGAYFLNAIADATGLNLGISPPAVMVDMAGAILDIALSDIMQRQDEILVVRTTFGTSNSQVDGTFLVMPTMEFLQAILKGSPGGMKW